MWDAASTTAVLTDAFADTTTIFASSIGVIVGGMIALVGLGFALRKLTKYVTGRKF